MMKDKRFEDILRRKLDGLSTPPPESWWTDIESALQSPSPASAEPQRVRFVRRPLWWMSAACVAAMVCIAVVVGRQEEVALPTASVRPASNDNMGSLGRHLQQAIKEAEAQAASPTEDAAHPSPTRGRHYTEEALSGSQATDSRRLLSAATAMAPAEAPYPAPQPPTETASGKPNGAPAGQKAKTDEREKEDESDAYIVHAPHHPSAEAYARPPQSPAIHRGGITANLYVSGFSAGHNVIQQNAFTPYQSVIAQPEANFTENSYALKAPESSLCEKHLPPFAVGASLRIPLTSRWGIETGLAYSILASTFTQSLPQREEHQRAHFIGIPLNVMANVFSRKAWNVYLSAGGKWEKCVEVYTDKPDANAPDKPHQWSLHAAAGGEYRFNRHLSLYLEPGFGYYFEQDTPLRTAYQTHPANFTLKLGLRFGINRR